MSELLQQQSELLEVFAGHPLLHESRPPPLLTVVVPTFNESANVPVLVERI